MLESARIVEDLVVLAGVVQEIPIIHNGDSPYPSGRAGTEVTLSWRGEVNGLSVPGKLFSDGLFNEFVGFILCQQMIE